MAVFPFPCQVIPHGSISPTV